MSVTTEQLKTKVQAVLAQPPGTPQGACAVQSLRDLSILASIYLEEKEEVPEEIERDVRALANASFVSSSPEHFRKLLQRLYSSLAALSAPVKEEPPLPATRTAVEEQANDLADDPELIQEFLMEAREHLSNVETGLLELERDSEQKESLHAVFRSFHTIKGLAGFLGAHTIQELAHETESVLDQVRSGCLTLNSGLTDLILQSADNLTKLLDQVGQLKLSELPSADDMLLSKLMGYARGERLEVEPAAPVQQAPELVSKTSSPAEVTKAPAPENVPGPKNASAAPKAGEKSGEKQQESGVVRVDTAKLEHLIDMVGELVIAESVVRNDQTIVRAEDPALSRNLAQLARVIEEVQKTSMSMRMIPVGVLFRKMTRLVRDVSRKSRKQAELVMFGEDVELDRTIVEELADPLIHMIRNAVDHGLETPEERIAAGKPAQGVVTLKAQHDAGDIVIEISDDGRGLAKDKILAKARRLGMISEDHTAEDAEIFRMIFEPGFSTATKVTDMSGRGVGMDVVKRHIQTLRGRIDIRSTPGQGCTFTLRLPLTLAIIDGLVVGVGSERYILPMFAVREMFSPQPETFITIENRAEAALFRDKLMPVVRLSTLFKVEDANQHPGILIVAEARDQLFCIAVDQLIGKQEVVIKNPGKTFRDVPAVAGGAILGDGRVGLILDVNALR